jgi:hypothetical protein
MSLISIFVHGTRGARNEYNNKTLGSDQLSQSLNLIYVTGKFKCYCLGTRFNIESSTELATEMSKRNWIHCEELIEEGVFAELLTGNLLNHAIRCCAPRVCIPSMLL